MAEEKSFKPELICEIRQSQYEICTVKELKRLLEDIPDEYTISDGGLSDIQLFIDHMKKEVLIDERKYIIMDALPDALVFSGTYLTEEEINEASEMADEMLGSGELKVKFFTKEVEESTVYMKDYTLEHNLEELKNKKESK